MAFLRIVAVSYEQRLVGTKAWIILSELSRRTALVRRVERSGRAERKSSVARCCYQKVSERHHCTSSDHDSDAESD